MTGPKVLVTGATGFISTYVLDRLLANGFEVVGTGRNEERIATLLRLFKKKYPDGKLQFEKTSDISKLDAFDNALKNHPDIKYVAHIASPIPKDSTMDKNFKIPAVNGVLGLFNGIKKYGPQIEKVSMVSTFGTCLQFLPEHSDVVYDETTWSDVSPEMVTDDNPVLKYIYSKIVAEKTAWDFIKNEKPNFILTTFLPPAVVGPQIFEELVDEKFESSNSFMFGFIDTKEGEEFTPLFPPFISIHVRDVAQAIIKPFGTDKLDGKRILTIASSFNVQDIIDKVHNFFPYVNGKMTVGNPESERASYKYNSSVSDKLLEQKFIPLDTQIIETFSQFNYVNGKF
ncbi:catalytic activity protein [[Candida] boidinii]|nr:catalytic activity protein [[Candida] boidinii]